MRRMGNSQCCAYPKTTNGTDYQNLSRLPWMWGVKEKRCGLFCAPAPRRGAFIPKRRSCVMGEKGAKVFPNTQTISGPQALSEQERIMLSPFLGIRMVYSIYSSVSQREEEAEMPERFMVSIA